MSQSRGRTYATRAQASIKRAVKQAAYQEAARTLSPKSYSKWVDKQSPFPSASRSPKAMYSKGPAKGTWTYQKDQRGKSSSQAKLGRKMTTAQTALKLTRSQLETVIYRWNGVKAFKDYGNYWLTNRVVTAGRRDLPLYMFDLTSLYSNGGSSANPFVQLTQVVASGAMSFDTRSGLLPGGSSAGSTLTWEVEKSPNAAALNPSYSKAMIKSANIKMNCWGAKSKATEYIIQLVQFTDDELVPSHEGFAAVPATAITTKRTDFYQSLIKKLTFNPISSTGGTFNKRMKVLKSQSFIIQPNSTDDGDADPQVRTVSMYVAMNRVMNYTESATNLTTDVITNDDSDYAVQGSPSFKPQARPKARVYLMIRASNYGIDTSETNIDTPSFDLSIRCTHQVTA